jgi:death-on-curing protein
LDDQTIESTVYLTTDDVIGLHAVLFGLTMSQAADHLRSRDVLEGAVARPRQHAHYAEADLALQAAVLAHGIAEGQPFVDGNKRTALVALYTFLEANGSTIDATEGALAHQILRLSMDLSADDFGAWVRASLVPSPGP